MKRRGFLGLLAAGADMPFLPSVAPAETVVASEELWTAATLTQKMEEMFACRMGPAASFFEIVDPVNASLVKRHVYMTFGLAVQGGSAAEAEDRLAKAFHASFEGRDQKNLVWRSMPQFQSEEVCEYGDVWATAEEIEDRFKSLDDKPENVAFDFDKHQYRYVTDRYPLHRMSMRLAFTDKDAEEFLLARKKGAPFSRIS
jgi:hypothetical protein